MMRNGQRVQGRRRLERKSKFRPFLERFEERMLLSTFVVTNTGDNGGINPAPGQGTGTLRQAIIDASAATGSSGIVFHIPASTAPNLDVPVPGFDPTTQDWTIT